MTPTERRDVTDWLGRLWWQGSAKKRLKAAIEIIRVHAKMVQEDADRESKQLGISPHENQVAWSLNHQADLLERGR